MLNDQHVCSMGKSFIYNLWSITQLFHTVLAHDLIPTLQSCLLVYPIVTYQFLCVLSAFCYGIVYSAILHHPTVLAHSLISTFLCIFAIYQCFLIIYGPNIPGPIRYQVWEPVITNHETSISGHKLSGCLPKPFQMVGWCQLRLYQLLRPLQPLFLLCLIPGPVRYQVWEPDMTSHVTSFSACKLLGWFSFMSISLDHI